MTSTMQIEKAYSVVTRFLPPRTAARVDLMRPSFRACWGGPMNGQLRRREIVREIAKTGGIQRVLETGTYRGATTEFLVGLFGVPVHTVEANPRNYEYSRRRLAVESQVFLELSDSRSFLRRMGERCPNETVFIYLDAHWEEDLPLREELDIISSVWTRCIVMVDDFEVPGDGGYLFDDYGSDKVLNAQYLPPSVADWGLHYPAASSSEESGARRGSCVLVSPAVTLSTPLLRCAG